MSLRIVTQPTEEPLSVDDARAHRRLDEDTDDALLEAMIVAARERAEHELQRSVVAKEYELTLDEFPAGTIYLPMSPAVPGATALTVASVKYTDAAGVEQTVSSANYTVDAYSHTPRIVPASGWPSAKAVVGAVRIRYTSGLAAAAVPQSIRQWMLLQIGAMYENREAAIVGPGFVVTSMPFADHLLDAYRSYA